MLISTKELPASANYLSGTTVRDTLEDIFQRESQHVAELVDGWVERGIDQLYLVGCGGSQAIMYPAKWLMDRFSPVSVDVHTGWEFVHRQPMRLNERSVAVLASHSGTTEEILKALELSKSRGATTLAFTAKGTRLAQEAEDHLWYDSPAVNLSKLLMAYLVAAHLIAKCGAREVGEELLRSLARLPERIHEIIRETEAKSKELAAQYRDVSGFYVVGTGLLAGLAYQYVTCTLLEMQWMHASMINSGEFPHGPIEIVQEDVPMIFLVGTDEARAVTQRAYNFAVKQGARTILFDLNEISDFNPYLAPFGLHIPLQWLAWYLAEERRHPLSTRRYMGKVAY